MQTRCREFVDEDDEFVTRRAVDDLKTLQTLAGVTAPCFRARVEEEIARMTAFC